MLNRRIEEKLYPQSASSHDYFVCRYNEDGNSKVNSYPNNKLTPQDQKDSTADICNEKVTSCEKEKSNQGEDEKEDERQCEERSFQDHEDSSTVSFRESNCVSTIKKHTTQQSEGYTNENSANSDSLDATNHMILPKDSQNNYEKKQSDMHWRRRITETLNPC